MMRCLVWLEVDVVGNVPESGGAALGIPKSDNGAEGGAEKRRDLSKCGSRGGP